MCVQACVAGMFELQDHAAFKDHLRDFLVQTKSFSSQDNADLFADEAAAAREVCLQGIIYLTTSVFWMACLRDPEFVLAALYWHCCLHLTCLQ